jgi:multiple sugar transport system permease protein
MALTIYYSFTKWGVFGGTTWIGFDNYSKLFTDSSILLALGNTTLYTGISLLSIPLAIFFAVLMNRPGLRFRRLFRTLYFLPVVTLPAAIAIVWRIVYNGDFGILNYFLGLVGIQGPNWLSQPGLAIIAVSLVGVWAGIGFHIVIVAAGLQAIPQELYESAQLDGAGGARQLWSITVPLLSPTIFFVSVLTVISSLKVFDLLYVMLGQDNPATQYSQTLVYLFYTEGFVDNDKGYAAALGIAIMALIAVVTYAQFVLQRKWVLND